MKKLLDFLDFLDSNEIYYRLNKVNENLLVEIAIPGQRWEVEFLPNGNVQVEKFISDGYIHTEKVLEELTNF